MTFVRSSTELVRSKNSIQLRTKRYSSTHASRKQKPHISKWKRARQTSICVMANICGKVAFQKTMSPILSKRLNNVYQVSKVQSDFCKTSSQSDSSTQTSSKKQDSRVELVFDRAIVGLLHNRLIRTQLQRIVALVMAV